MFNSMVIFGDSMDNCAVENQAVKDLVIYFKTQRGTIFACLVQTCVSSNLNFTFQQETTGETLAIFLECVFSQNRLLILKFYFFLAVYSELCQFTVVKLEEKYVLEPPY